MEHNVVVIDGQGGGCGKALITQLVAKNLPITIIAVGTNAMATSAMLKAGANYAATGENAVVVNASKANYIMGPVGIIVANALMGECTLHMALAVANSSAEKILVPVSKCGITIAGLQEKTMGDTILSAVNQLEKMLGI